MEEPLTAHRLRIPEQLRRTLSSTNVIESAFSIVETVCRNVKRWRGGDQIERWVAYGLLVAKDQFRKVIGYIAIFPRCYPLWKMLSQRLRRKPVQRRPLLHTL